MAVNFPKAGETTLMIQAEMKYHKNVRPGPSQPTSSANFLENSQISRHGLVKFKYKFAKDKAHLSRS
jgi:hypothetical protein